MQDRVELVRQPRADVVAGRTTSQADARRRRRLAAERACFESALRDAARRGSRLSALKVARDLFADGFLRGPPRYARLALFRVRADA